MSEYEDARAVGPHSRKWLRFVDWLQPGQVRDEAPGGSARDDGMYVLADGAIVPRGGREASLASRAPTAAPVVGQAGMGRVDPAILAALLRAAGK